MLSLDCRFVTKLFVFDCEFILFTWTTLMSLICFFVFCKLIVITGVLQVFKSILPPLSAWIDWISFVCEFWNSFDFWRCECCATMFFYLSKFKWLNAIRWAFTGFLLKVLVFCVVFLTFWTSWTVSSSWLTSSSFIVGSSLSLKFKSIWQTCAGVRWWPFN